MTDDRSNSRMVFVVGSSRSGTTLMAGILGRSPRVFTFNELHFFERLWTPAMGLGHLDVADAVRLYEHLLETQERGIVGAGQRLSPDTAPPPGDLGNTLAGLTATEVYAAFLHAYRQSTKPDAVPLDQTPRNVFYLREILTAFPGARIVNMVRDPRDVLVSQKNKRRRARLVKGRRIPRREIVRLWINYHPITVSRLWSAAVSAAEKWAEDSRVRTVRFEDLLSCPAETVRSVCEFVGIPYDENLLSVAQTNSSVLPDDPETRGINPARSQAWRGDSDINPAELRLCQRITKHHMLRHGYETVDVPASRLRVALLLTSFPLKLAAACLANLRRSRNLLEAARRRLKA